MFYALLCRQGRHSPWEPATSQAGGILSTALSAGPGAALGPQGGLRGHSSHGGGKGGKGPPCLPLPAAPTAALPPRLRLPGSPSRPAPAQGGGAPRRPQASSVAAHQPRELPSARGGAGGKPRTRLPCPHAQNLCCQQTHSHPPFASGRKKKKKKVKRKKKKVGVGGRGEGLRERRKKKKQQQPASRPRLPHRRAGGVPGAPDSPRPALYFPPLATGEARGDHWRRARREAVPLAARSANGERCIREARGCGAI